MTEGSAKSESELELLLEKAKEITDKIEIDSQANIISGKIERYRQTYNENTFIRKYYREARDWYKSTK